MSSAPAEPTTVAETTPEGSPAAEPTYSVVKIEKTTPLPGTKGTWYSYVIEGGYAPVAGVRSGTRKEITQYAENLAVEINARRAPNAPSHLSPRSGQRKTA